MKDKTYKIRIRHKNRWFRPKKTVFVVVAEYEDITCIDHSYGNGFADWYKIPVTEEIAEFDTFMEADSLKTKLEDYGHI